MTERTAVYRLYDGGGGLLYVGASDELEKRWKHHSYMQPWWPEVRSTKIEWHPDRPAALTAETAAIKAERPKYNIIHSLDRPPTPVPDPAASSRYLTTTETGRKVKASRYTVEREIHRGNLSAKQMSGRWVIEAAEADRWAAQYRPYAEQRDRDRTPAGQSRQDPPNGDA